MPEPSVRHDEAARRFVWIEEGETAVLDYRFDGEAIVFLHTEVPRKLEGRGIAGKLVASGLAFARERGSTVVPLCPYVAGYLGRHPEALELVRPDWRDRLGATAPGERRRR